MKLTTDFAFEGFRIIRQKPSVILFWGVFVLVFNGLATYAFLSLSGTAMQDLMQASQAGRTADPTAILDIYARLAPAYAVMLPLSVLMQAIISCAVFRTVLSPKSAAFGNMRVGGDELRQIVVAILFSLIIIGLEIACLLSGGIVSAILGVALGFISKPLAGLGVFLGISVGVLALIWFILRLSLAPVQSFDQKRVNMFGSWSLTKNSWGTLLVGYIIALIMALLVACLCLTIFAVIVIVLSHGDFAAMSQMFGMAKMGLSALENPIVIAYFVVMNLIVTPLLMAISIGAPAAAYQTLSGGMVKAESLF